MEFDQPRLASCGGDILRLEDEMAFCSARHDDINKTARQILARAKRAKLIVVTAESCTAGQLVSLLSLQPAAAEALAGGFVVYSKTSKARVLDVPAATLRRATAVSREVAVAMAKGALRRSGAQIAVAVTGVAGPASDEDGNPVGLAFVATAARGGPASCQQLQLGSRNPNRNLHAMHRVALDMLQDAIARQGGGRTRQR